MAGTLRAAERHPVAGYEFLGGLTDEETTFRAALTVWLEGQLNGTFAHLRGALAPIDDDEWRRQSDWEKVLFTHGWRGIGWPIEYGGRGGSFVDELIFEIEYARANAPYRPSIQGERLLGPMLLACGSDALRRRFLPEIVAARQYWCQGFSEPDAGSDLANVRTTAAIDGKSWRVTGQKIWTTAAHHADWMYLLCRTDPGGTRHRGLSVLLVPMDQPGVEVRRIRTVAGDAEFCEVFLDGACTEQDLVLGDVGDGWGVARRLLQVERGITMLGHQLQYERELETVIKEFKRTGRRADLVLRQRIAQQWATLRLLRLSTSAMLAVIADGGDTGTAASRIKLMSSAWQQRLGSLAVDISGPGALAGPGGTAVRRLLLESRGASIYGGSDEIQRNLLAEHGLGMPR